MIVLNNAFNLIFFQLCLAGARATELFSTGGGGWLGSWSSSGQCSQQEQQLGELLLLMAMLALTHTSDGFLAPLWAQFGSQHNLGPNTIWISAQFGAQTHNLAQFGSHLTVVARHETLQTLAMAVLEKISCSATVYKSPGLAQDFI